MKTVKLAALIAASMVSSAAMANVVTDTAGSVFDGTKTLIKTAVNPAAVSLEVGTLGYGANIAWSANETTELQAGWAGGNIAEAINDNFDANGVNYQLTTDFSNPYLGVQMRPAANWLTVGAGVIVPDNDIKVKSNPQGSGAGAYYRIGGENVPVSQLGTLEGQLEHKNTLAPYLTVGFRPNLNKNWGVFGEIGAAYLGEVDATVTAVTSDGTRSAAAQNRYAAQAEKDLESKDYLEWMPIAKLGLTYRF